MHRTKSKERTRPALALLLLALLAGCGSSWQAEVIAPDGSIFAVDRQVLEELAAENGMELEEGLPLEQVLWAAGHAAVERLAVVDPEGARREFDWPATTAGTVDPLWLAAGRLSIGEATLDVARLEVEPPALLDRVQAGIVDLAPAAAAALGLPAPEGATGSGLDAPRAGHVLLLFLDGLGYVRYSEAAAAGLMPNLAALEPPLAGLTVYPPATSVATAALLSGAPPPINGVGRRGIRQTEAQTLFDVAASAGLRVVAVEGNALAFNLRGAEITLSGDRDGDGSTDDNVLANALAAAGGGMPDLLYVHFHGIDDAGHTYGPGAPEEEAAIRRVDAAVGRLLDALPGDTLIYIFADHGLHRVVGEEEEEAGNHGHLIERDMFVPIWIVEK
ncbi:MAG: alkaline phosphatase family protein [Anaerolineae bacterium]|jgi:hypothetical protein